ncbi:universal stress protein [Pseudolysinimonas sp.]|uniref:universal stress protein n=1 Tax=Pseudolysinimonas sp. TaxID=2680009 RepID=UPI003F823148
MFPAVHPDEAQVVVAFDGSAASYDALAWGARWASGGGTVIAVVVERLRRGDRALAPRSADRALRDAREWMGASAPGVRFRTTAAHGDARAMLEESCRTADLLILAAGSAPSRSARIAREAPCPVLLLPMRAGAPAGDLLVERVPSDSPVAVLGREAEWRLGGALRVVGPETEPGRLRDAGLLVVRRSIAVRRRLLTRRPARSSSPPTSRPGPSPLWPLVPEGGP